MRQYEVTFIVDPVLSGDEIKSAEKTYTEMLTKEGCKIVHIDNMGLKQLAYPINKRNSGFYYCVEFNVTEGDIIPKLELSLQRDERVMRFLTVKLDKYGVKYNEDRRNGVIAKFEKRDKKKPRTSASAITENKEPGKPAIAQEVAIKKEPAKTIVKSSSEEE